MRHPRKQPKIQCPFCGCWYSTVMATPNVRQGRGKLRTRRCDECYERYDTVEEPVLPRQEDD